MSAGLTTILYLLGPAGDLPDLSCIWDSHEIFPESSASVDFTKFSSSYMELEWQTLYTCDMNTANIVLSFSMQIMLLSINNLNNLHTVLLICTVHHKWNKYTICESRSQMWLVISNTLYHCHGSHNG